MSFNLMKIKRMLIFCKYIMEIPLYHLSGIFTRKKNRIIFGAWNGTKYADNSKYMMEYLSKFDEYQLVWCGKKEIKSQVPIKPNITFVPHGSLRSYYYALTSQYVFISHGVIDIGRLNLLKGATVIQLWHGVGIKKLWTLPSDKLTWKDKLKIKIMRVVRNYDYFICSSEQNKIRNLKALELYGINDNNVMCSGQPRNDLLLNYDETLIGRIREKYKKRYMIPSNKKIITYLPTYRNNKENRFLFSKLDHENLEKIKKILKENNTIILQKVHYQDQEIENNDFAINSFIYDISKFNDIDTQELLLISDILITDYSSCYMDYTLLSRPIIHFAYDYDKYNNDEQGLYYDLVEIAAGDIVTDVDGLLKSIQLNLKNPDLNSDKRRKIRETMMEYEQGNSCEKIAETLGLN